MDLKEILEKKKANLSPEQLAKLQNLLTGNTAQPVQECILPRKIRETAPLSYLQERFWFLYEWEPEAPTYNECQMIRIKGPLDINALEKAYRELALRHEILRTTYDFRDTIPVQIIHPALEWSLPVFDFSSLLPEEQESALKKLGEKEANTCFDLRHEFSWRVVLAKLNAQEHIVFVTQHHISCDGWSIELRNNEINVLYGAAVLGLPAALPELAVHYADYACWQRDWLNSQKIKPLLAYWKETLAGYLPFEFPADKKRPPIRTSNGATVKKTLPLAVIKRIEQFGQKDGLTPFMINLAVFLLLLYRYTNQTDILIATTVSNRDQPGLERLIGIFIETILLRTDLAGNPTFLALCDRVRTTMLGAFSNKDLPFMRVVSEFQHKREPDRLPFTQIMFIWLNFESGSRQPASAAGFPLEMEAVHVTNATSKYDITLTIESHREFIALSWEYNTDLFEAATIERLADNFQCLLYNALEAPGIPIADYSLLSGREKERLLVEWNNTALFVDGNTCVHGLFEVCCRKNPAARALSCNGREITYGELNNQANRLACYLSGLGLKRGDLVAIRMEHSVEMCVALFAVLKAGACYLPVDPAYPEERTVFMLADSAARFIITRAGVPGIKGSSVPVIDMDGEWKETVAGNIPDPAGQAEPSGLAYVIYTSGSTGKPKGVKITHSNVLNFLAAMTNRIGITEKDLVLAHTTISFDIAVLEIFWPLVNGAGVCLITRDLASNSDLLMKKLPDSGVTIMQATPSHWKMLLSGGWENKLNIKALCGGEALSLSLAASLLQRVDALWNMYGPTETTVWSLVHKLTPSDLKRQSIPIGKPVANTQIYILDANLNPVPIGVAGELFIGGYGVSQGYLNREELTQERFVSNPFINSLTRENHRVMYKTGDLARYLPDGSIEFIGRRDFQVKIRGYRIELGEIESALRTFPGISDTVLVHWEDQVRGDNKLVAYLVPHAGIALPVAAVREFLEQKLPRYMLPHAFMIIDQFPLTPNGKLDRKALPAPEANLVRENEYAAPHNTVENDLVQIWQDVLNLSRVGITDDFFMSGGDSISAIQILALARNKGYPIDLVNFFNFPTIKELAEKFIMPRLNAEHKLYDRESVREKDFYIEPEKFSLLDHDKEMLSQEALADSNPAHSDIEDIYPLSYMQKVVLTQNIVSYKKGDDTNIIFFQIEGEIDQVCFTKAWEICLNRHPVLRTCFRWRKVKQPVQIVFRSLDLPVAFLDWSEWDDKERNLTSAEFIQKLKYSGFDVAVAPLMKIILIKLEAAKYRFLWAHLESLFDGWSANLVINELFTNYHRLKANAECDSRRFYFSRYIKWLKEMDINEAKAFWENELQGFIPGSEKRQALSKNSEFSLKEQELYLSESDTVILENFIRNNSITLNTVFQCAWGSLLNYYCGQEDTLISTLLSGRPLDIKNSEIMVGLFNNILPVRIKWLDNESMLAWMKKLQEKKFSIQKYSFVTLNQVAGWAGVPVSLLQDVVYTRTIVHLNLEAPGEAAHAVHGELRMEKRDNLGGMNVPLRLYIKGGKKIAVSIRYNRIEYNDGYVKKMLSDFHKTLVNLGSVFNLTAKEYFTKLFCTQGDALWMK